MSENSLDWRAGATENGHAWEHGYRPGPGNVLVTIRCANCGTDPMTVLRRDFTVEPCRGKRV